ncbi:MAG: hypothetical protein GX442_14085 [Candidatus Riflebacteria bacterium]|nr:hypothetical protein [Candidatus Riflebacteria bacterium]
MNVPARPLLENRLRVPSLILALLLGFSWALGAAEAPAGQPGMDLSTAMDVTGATGAAAITPAAVTPATVTAATATPATVTPATFTPATATPATATPATGRLSAGGSTGGTRLNGATDISGALDSIGATDIAVSTPFSDAVPASGPSLATGAVGIVDMLVLNALHPTMARFDFQRRAFRRIPFQMPPAEREALFTRLREEARRQEPAFQEALGRLASQEADIVRRRGEVLDALRTIASPTGRLALEQELRQLQEEQLQVQESQEEVRCRWECPEYTPASETRATLEGIEREVFAVIAAVAAREGVQVVLNANLPYPPADPATARISPMAQNRLAWLETDLYYSFLASSAADAAVYDPVADGAAADEWVKLIRHPAAAPFFPVRPYPLVLQGGTDLTGKVLAALLERHHVDPRRARTLVEAVGRLRGGD